MLRLRTLNPNVLISADTDGLEEKDAEYLSRFDVVVVTCSTTEQLVRNPCVHVFLCVLCLHMHAQVRVDEICRDKQIKFFCGDVWGYYGYFFTDLGEHEYAM